MTKFEFQAIGTLWQVDIVGPLSKDEEVVLLKKIKDRIDIFDKDYSRFREDSLVTKMSKESGSFSLPTDADKMISLYKRIFDITGGLVTPLIGQVISDAGYDAKYSLISKPLTSPLSWDEVMKWENPLLTLFSPVLLDFGAGGKGYLVDIVSEILEANGIKSYCVDAGGDMRQRSPDGVALKVGLEHPGDKTAVVAVANVLNQSICGSAGNRRAWGDFHHIINPKSLTSPRDILSVWVVAETTLLADLLTTGLFFVSPEILLQHFAFEYLIVYHDYSMKKSEGFDAEVFTRESII